MSVDIAKIICDNNDLFTELIDQLEIDNINEGKNLEAVAQYLIIIL